MNDIGWDTCPMIGFDPEQLTQLLSISDQFEPVQKISNYGHYIIFFGIINSLTKNPD